MTLCSLSRCVALLGHNELTHWGLNKIAEALQTSSNKIFSNENVLIWIGFAQNFDPKDPIDKRSSLFHVMVWRWTGDKPLLKTMTQITDVFLRHQALMSYS